MQLIYKDSFSSDFVFSLFFAAFLQILILYFIQYYNATAINGWSVTSNFWYLKNYIKSDFLWIFFGRIIIIAWKICYVNIFLTYHYYIILMRNIRRLIIIFHIFLLMNWFFMWRYPVIFCRFHLKTLHWKITAKNFCLF